jgi:hypothetical protein
VKKQEPPKPPRERRAPAGGPASDDSGPAPTDGDAGSPAGDDAEATPAEDDVTPAEDSAPETAGAPAAPTGS